MNTEKDQGQNKGLRMRKVPEAVKKEVAEGAGGYSISAKLEPATMAGHDSGSQHQFTGFQKYFNSYTITGRRNYVIATYTGIAMLVLYFKLRPKKKTPAVADK